MDVASLIVRIGADVSSLEAGLSRASSLVEANAGKMKQAGAAAAESGTAATAAQDKFNAALARTQAQLQALKGDSLGSLKTSFPSVSDADLSKMATLKSEIGGVKAQLLEEAGAAKEAEKAIAAAGKEGVAAMQLQRKALKEAEAEWASYAASVEKSSAAGNKALAKDAKASKGPGAYGAITSPSAGKLADAGLMVGGGIAAGLGAAVADAAGFDTAMRDMNASLRLNEAEFAKVRKAVLDLTRDPEVLSGPKELAKAFYEPASVLPTVRQALDALHQGARLAAGGLGDVKDATHLMTTVLKTGISGVSSASEAADVLARAVHMGSIHVQDLAEHFPQMAQMGKAAGISLQDLLSAYVGLSRRGIDAGHASELLTQLLNRILKPAKQAQGIFDELGISWGRSGIKATGLTGIIQQLSEANKHHADTLDAAMGKIQSFQAVMALTDQDGKEYKDTLAGLTDKTKVVGAAHESIKQQVAGAGGSFKALQKDVERLGVDIGDKLLPQMKSAVHGLDDLVNSFGKLSPGNQQAIVKSAEYSAFFLILVSGAQKAMAVIGPLLQAIGKLGMMGDVLGSVFKPTGGGALAAFEKATGLGVKPGAAAPAPAAPPAPTGAYTMSDQVKQFMAAHQGGAPPGVHPADTGATKKLTEAQKESVAAGKEMGRLSLELNALHRGQSKAVGDLEARYHLLSPAIRKHIEALREQRDAYIASQKEQAKHAAALEKEREKYQSAVKDARAEISDLASGGTERSEAMGKLAREFPDLTQAQREYLQGLRDSVKAEKEDAQTLKSLNNEVETSRGKLLQQQAAAAAGGRVWDVHALALEKTHKAYESLTAPMRAAIDQLAKIGQQGDSANALEKMAGEVRKAAAELQFLRTGDSVGLLRAENLGVDDATLGKMDAYRQQLLGIKNATEAIKAKTAPIIDPASKNALEAIKRYAGTGNMEAQQAQGQANQLNQIAKMLNQYTAGNGGDSRQRLDFLKQGGLPPELLATLQKTVGSVDAFFGGIEKQSQAAADEITKANAANQQGAMAYLTATKDWGAGLVRNLSAMDQMVSDIHAAAMSALQSSGSGISGHRAMGGPVSSGRSYIVGERGPEIFTPGAGGNITPNSALGGGGTNIVMHVHTADAASFRRSGSQLLTDLHRASEYHRGRNG